MTQSTSLSSIVDRLTTAKVAVVGDVMLDRFVEEASSGFRRRNPGYYGAKQVDARGGRKRLAESRRWAQAEISGRRSAMMQQVQRSPVCWQRLRTATHRFRRSTGVKRRLRRYIASGPDLRADRETIEDIPQECQDAIFVAVEAQLSTARALLHRTTGRVLVEGLVSALYEWRARKLVLLS